MVSYVSIEGVLFSRSVAGYSRVLYGIRCCDITMKYVQVVNTSDPDTALPIFNLLARSTSVTETRLYEWNISANQSVTGLFEVIGDRDRFQGELSELDSVKWYDITPVSDRRFNLLMVLDLGNATLLSKGLEELTQEKLILMKPVLYRNGRNRAQIVGTSSVLQSVISELPPERDMSIERIGVFNQRRERPLSGLSDRQQETLSVAFELGYYEFPRAATHADIAERLDCAPNTASEHLQKAEAKIISTALQ